MRIRLFACIAAAGLLLTGASVWEGSAQAASGRELPGAGFYAATNSFPVNSVVDITNLENGRTVRVIVAAGLDGSGLLAVLSTEAALTIGLSNTSAGRIRMTQPTDPIAFAQFRQGMPFSGVQATVEQNPLSIEPQAFVSANFEENPVVSADVPLAEAVPGKYDLVPSEERIPDAAAQHTISPDDIIPPLEPVSPKAAETGENAARLALDDYSFAPEITALSSAESSSAGQSSPAPFFDEFGGMVDSSQYEFSPFAAPMIRGMEQGKCYVQLGAYSKAEVVEDEIARIGTAYPVAIQNIGTDENPLFRVLLGPFNLGESGAALQRFKSIGYRDAFVRKN